MSGPGGRAVSASVSACHCGVPVFQRSTSRASSGTMLGLRPALSSTTSYGLVRPGRSRQRRVQVQRVPGLLPDDHRELRVQHQAVVGRLVALQVAGDVLAAALLVAAHQQANGVGARRPRSRAGPSWPAAPAPAAPCRRPRPAPGPGRPAPRPSTAGWSTWPPRPAARRRGPPGPAPGRLSAGTAVALAGSSISVTSPASRTVKPSPSPVRFSQACWSLRACSLPATVGNRSTSDSSGARCGDPDLIVAGVRIAAAARPGPPGCGWMRGQAPAHEAAAPSPPAASTSRFDSRLKPLPHRLWASVDEVWFSMANSGRSQGVNTTRCVNSFDACRRQIDVGPAPAGSPARLPGAMPKYTSSRSSWSSVRPWRRSRSRARDRQQLAGGQHLLGLHPLGQRHGQAHVLAGAGHAEVGVQPEPVGQPLPVQVLHLVADPQPVDQQV